MKNVDVPIWDKGDDTDDFSKGGASSSFSFTPPKEKSSLLKKIYKQVLGREPTSREISYYKYSSLKKEDIIKKLLEDDEHKEILKKAKEYSNLKEENSKSKSTVLKLRTLVDDKDSEYIELKRLLVEKNSIIESLRQNKDIPFLTTKKIIEENNIHYSTSRTQATQPTKTKESFFDRLLYLVMGERK